MTSIKLKQNLKLDMRKQLFVLNSKKNSEEVNPNIMNLTPTIIAAANNFRLNKYNYRETTESPSIKTMKHGLIVPSALVKQRRQQLNGRSLDFEVSLLNNSSEKQLVKIASKNKTRSTHDPIQLKVSKLKRLTSMHRKLQLRPKLESNGKNVAETKKLFRPDYTSTPNYNLPKTSTPVLLRKLKKEQSRRDKEKKFFTATTTTRTTKKMINLAPPKCNCHYYNSTFKDENPFKIDFLDISSSSSCSSSLQCSFSLCKNNKAHNKKKKNQNRQFGHYHHDYMNFNDHQSIFYNYQYIPATTLMKTIKKTTTAKTTNIILSSKEFYHHKEEANQHHHHHHRHRVNIDYEFLNKRQRNLNKHNYENVLKKNTNRIYENANKPNENPIITSYSSKLIKKLKHNKIKKLLEAASAISSSKCQTNTSKKESKRKFIQKLAKDTKCLMQFENVIRV